jgi:TPR repeat protein
LGIVDAQVVCGVLFSLGIYGETDQHSARFWIQSAADREHPAALLMLASLVRGGSDCVSPDAPRALSLIQRAVDMEYAPALVQMAVRRLEGIHVEKNRALGLEYLGRAATLGDSEAQYLLGIELLTEGPVEERAKAVHWLEVSAADGFADAHRFLADLYRDGAHGFSESKEKSQFHSLAAEEIEASACSVLRCD